MSMFTPHHVAISIIDLERSISFYERFGFREVMRWQAGDGSLSIVQMKLDTMLLEVFCYHDSSQSGLHQHSLERDLRCVGVRHFGLRVADIHACRRQLIDEGLIDDSVKVTHGRTGIDYLFIRDPDGLFIEIVQDDRKL